MCFYTVVLKRKCIWSYHQVSLLIRKENFAVYINICMASNKHRDVGSLKLSSTLKEYGFWQSVYDYSLFDVVHHGVLLYVLVYVDDLIIIGSSPKAISDFKSYLDTCFYMKDLGVLKYCLDIEVVRSPARIYLCQRKYTLDILDEIGLLGTKPSGFPTEQNHKLVHADGPLLTDPTPYWCLVGQLIYLADTRPDLAYSVHFLSQFLSNPREDHWNATLRVVILKETPVKTFFCELIVILTGLTARSHQSLTRWFIQLG